MLQCAGSGCRPGKVKRATSDRASWCTPTAHHFKNVVLAGALRNSGRRRSDLATAGSIRGDAVHCYGVEPEVLKQKTPKKTWR